jgi:hypothetical protein
VTSPKRRTAINTKVTINFLTPVPHLFIILTYLLNYLITKLCS